MPKNGAADLEFLPVEDDRVLKLLRSSIKVGPEGWELGRVPLADIQSVLVPDYGTMVSLSLRAAMAEAGIPLLLCALNHPPIALTLPVSANFEQAVRGSNGGGSWISHSEA